MDFQKFDWLWRKPSRQRAMAGVAIIALVSIGYVVGRNDPKGNLADGIANAAVSATPTGSAAPEAVTGGMPRETVGAPLTPLEPLSAGQCHTFAPAGWRVIDQNKDGTVFTLQSGDGRLSAAYAGAAVGAGLVQGYYGPQYRTPETFALYAVQTITGEPAQQTGAPEPVGPYEAIRFTSASHSGYVLLYRFQVPDPGGYGVMLRIAIGNAGDAHSVGIAGAVAAAARCTAVLHPSTGPVYRAPRDDHGAGRAGGDGDMAGTYNAQLGTGWVHDPATGQNYNVDVTSDWRENGPAGPGYYKQNGNDVTKLQPGLM